MKLAFGENISHRYCIREESCEQASYQEMFHCTWSMSHCVGIRSAEIHFFKIYSVPIFYLDREVFHCRNAFVKSHGICKVLFRAA